MICYLNTGSHGDDYVSYLNDLIDVYDFVSAYVLQRKAVYHGIRPIISICGMPCLFSDIPFQTPFRFNIIKTLEKKQGNV